LFEFVKLAFKMFPLPPLIPIPVPGTAKPPPFAIAAFEITRSPTEELINIPTSPLLFAAFCTIVLPPLMVSPIWYHLNHGFQSEILQRCSF